ncbi:MAG TPA: AbrB/MazE/SpoVT family DNA-binding domain-containing protein [Vicinamibacteria bacterium]|nr:AbrB/MazE/SpoVT family DNA-binding domain-containing protein [Vicinamibacteria bacterium]
MPIETMVDRFGRVVIPKKTRDRFGLEPGTALTVTEQDDGILLEPEGPEAPLRLKGHVLVFAGETTTEAPQVVRRHREERLQRLMPRGRR